MLARSLLLITIAVAVGALTLAQLSAPDTTAPDTTAPDTTAAPSPSATFATSRPPDPAQAITATPGAPSPIPDGFRVRLRRLAIDLPIREGVVQRDIEQQQTPEGFAFHLPGTAVPGQVGNTYLYAHARRGMFLSLWNARVGDVVEVTKPDGAVLTYVVDQVRPRVAPTDVSVADPTPDERLTLQTSTGPSPDDPRFVVIALPRR